MLYAGRIRAQGTVDELLRDTERTVIETARLQADTISQIERILEQTEGKGIDRVESPRQRLEQFFMELVEKARREQIETAGVVHGGATASFLQAAAAEGERLIEELVRPEPEPGVREAAPATAEPEAPQRAEVLEELLAGEPAAKTTEPAPAAPAPEAPADVDSSVIDSLLGREEATESSEDEKT